MSHDTDYKDTVAIIECLTKIVWRGDTQDDIEARADIANRISTELCEILNLSCAEVSFEARQKFVVVRNQ